MTRSKILLAWGALLLGLSACDKTTDTAGGTAKPSNLTVSLSSSELTAGGVSVDVAVAATSDTGILSIAPTFKNSSGGVVVSSFVPSFTTMPKPGDKTFASSGWKLSALSTATAGSYTMALTLTDKSGAVTVKEVAFTVKSKTVIDPLDPDPVDPDPVTGEPLYRMRGVTAGAQSSSNGSFFELGGSHAGWLYTSDADFSSKVIDVVFGADGTVPSFMSPKYASTHGFNLSSWTTLNQAAIVDMGTSKPANTGVVDQALDAGFAESVPVIANHYYGVGTISGDLVVLHVTSLTGAGRSANAGVDIYVVEGSEIDPVDPILTAWPTLTLGAQAAAPGSYLDIDGKLAWTAGAKSAEQIASIDLIFLASASGVPMFYSPWEADDVAMVTNLSSWGVKNETFIVDVGTTPITSRSEAMAAGASDAQSVVAAVGHYYAVESAGGTYSALKVESITGLGRNAVVTVSMKTF